MSVRHWLDIDRERLFRLVLLGIVVVAIAWASVNLLDSPRPWFDEALYLQSARMLAEQGKYALPIAPHETVPLSFITVGFPLLLPIAFVFRIFGTSFFAARVVMLGFLGVCIALAALWSRRRYGRWAGVWTALLFATFSPLYGNGKNVLGEVPGLVFTFAASIALLHIERGKRGAKIFGVFGFLLGLAAVTKPAFLPLLPAAALAAWIGYRRGIKPLAKEWLAFAAAFLLVFGHWILSQFGGAFSGVLGHYANPYGLANVADIIWKNLVGFFQDPTPLHFLGALLFVCFAFWKRGFKRLGLSELFLLVFIFLTWIAYFRTLGWYRYFFLAHVIALAMLPGAVLYLVRRFLGWKSKLVFAVLPLFLLANAYALYKDPFPLYGTDWRALETYVQTLPDDEPVLFANVPEGLFFYRGSNATQYLKVTEALTIHGVGLETLQNATSSRMIVSEGLSDFVPASMYVFEKRFGSVFVWKRRQAVLN